MKRRLFSALVFLALCGSLCSGVQVAFCQIHAFIWDKDNGMQDLGTLPGGYFSGAVAINSAGQVIGYGDDATGKIHAFIWDKDNGMQDLGTLPGGYFSDPTAINDAGQVVGHSSDATGKAHAFIWDKDNGMQDLGTLGENYSFAFAINSSGQVVGRSTDGTNNGHAFIWDKDNGMQDLGTLPGGNHSGAGAINSAGQVVGSSSDLAGNGRAFIWDKDNGMQDLGTLPGRYYDSLTAAAINSSGQVIGRSTDGTDNGHAFIWDKDNGMQDLSALPGRYVSLAAAINSLGQVVGSSYDPLDDPPLFAVIWDKDNGVQDLGTLGGNYSHATAINDAGQVVGRSQWAANPPVIYPVIYEDAEDGATAGWDIYDSVPAGARIANVYDQLRGSRVIELRGAGMDNGYRLGNPEGSLWHNSSQSLIEWSMRYSERFTVYVDVQTSQGQRYLTYTPDGFSNLGTDRYIHHGLGSWARDGQWHTFTRDLAADLEEAQPGNLLLEVNGFLVRGRGRVDDISLWSAKERFWIEGESGRLTSPIRVGVDTSGVRFIWAPPGSGNVVDPALSRGSARYDFTISEAGFYVIWARTLAPNEGYNSFFTSMDEESYRTRNVPVSSSWVWHRVETRYLSAGAHNLIVKHREQGAKLDKIFLTLDPDYVP